MILAKYRKSHLSRDYNCIAYRQVILCRAGKMPNHGHFQLLKYSAEGTHMAKGQQNVDDNPRGNGSVSKYLGRVKAQKIVFTNSLAEIEKHWNILMLFSKPKQYTLIIVFGHSYFPQVQVNYWKCCFSRHTTNKSTYKVQLDNVFILL